MQAPAPGTSGTDHDQSQHHAIRNFMQVVIRSSCSKC